MLVTRKVVVRRGDWVVEEEERRKRRDLDGIDPNFMVGGLIFAPEIKGKWRDFEGFRSEEDEVK